MDISKDHVDFANFVNCSDNSESLYTLYNKYIVQKMKLDKYFSEFLEENEKEMNESINFDSPAWITYRKKLKEYDEVDKFIARTRYHLNKNV
jgi:hypothetical protein